MEIAAEAVGRGVGVTDVVVGSQQPLGGFRGRFLVEARPRSSLHLDKYRSEMIPGMSLHLNSCRSRGRRRVSSIRQGRWAIPQELSHKEQD